MSKENFNAAFEYTIGNEGDFSNDSNDSGGPTRFGITIHDLSRFLGRPATMDEVRTMPIETAQTIYKNWYWDVLSLDQVNSQGVAMAMFDQGLVRGTSTIAKAVQNMVGVTPDAHIGPITLSAINNADAIQLIQQIEDQAIDAFQEIVDANPKDAAFLRGWVNRAHRLLSLEKYA